MKKLALIPIVGNTERGVKQYFFSIVNFCQLDSSQLKNREVYNNDIIKD